LITKDSQAPLLHTLSNINIASSISDLDKLFKSIAYNTEMNKAKTKAIITKKVNIPLFKKSLPTNYKPLFV